MLLTQIKGNIELSDFWMERGWWVLERLVLKLWLMIINHI